MIRLTGLLLSFFLASIQSAFAQTCPGFGTSIKNVVYFVNGVDNSQAQMRASRDEIRRAVGNTGLNQYKVAENLSNGIGFDFYQALKNRQADVDPRQFWKDARMLRPSATNQAIREEYADAIYSASVVEYARSPDLRVMIDNFLTDLRAGKKVILVSHSQGNFFSNAAYRFISRNWPQYIDSVGIVSVASPAPIVEGGGFLTQNSRDVVIFGAVSTKYRVQSSNVTYKGRDAFFTDHGFLTTFMLPRNGRSRIANHVKATISRLKTPLSPCDQDVAVISTKTGTNIRAKSATLRANIQQGRNADYWFVIDRNTQSVTCGNRVPSSARKVTAPASISFPVNGLRENTIYNVRACAKGAKGAISDGGLVQLITQRNIGKASVPNPVKVTKDSIEVQTTVLNGQNIDVWVIYGDPRNENHCTRNPDGVGPYSKGDVVTSKIRNLVPNTRYEIRSCAKGSFGVTNGSNEVYISTSSIPVRTCSPAAFRGGTEGLSVIYNLGNNTGYSRINFETFTIPDSIDIFKHGTNQRLLSSNGFISGQFSRSFFVNSSFDKVDVYVTANSNINTEWELILECPR